MLKSIFETLNEMFLYSSNMPQFDLSDKALEKSSRY